MRFPVVAALLVVGLAGCSSPGPEPDVASASSSSSPPVLVFEPTPPTTDTVHLLEAPHLSGQVPATGEPLRQAVPSAYDNPGGGSVPIEWTMPRPDLPVLTGEVVLWVDVQGTVANAGYAQAAGCFWILWVAIIADDGDQTEIGSCTSELPIVPTGVRQLRWDLPTFDVTEAVGDTLVFGLQTTAAPGNSGTVTLLSGNGEVDSVVRLDGLLFPVDRTTLLV